eukprot:4077724-Prymnesium_polylepis.1
MPYGEARSGQHGSSQPPVAQPELTLFRTFTDASAKCCSAEACAARRAVCRAGKRYRRRCRRVSPR